jgi:hypothetical protein
VRVENEQFHYTQDMEVIDLSKLNFIFSSKPLLVGGKAMEYYGLRQAGADIDFVITAEDYRRLSAQYPDHLKDLWGDLGVCEFEFEIWQSICLLDYDYLSCGAVELDEYLVISLERLLVLKALAVEVEKYRKDVLLIAKKISGDRFAAWWPTLSAEQQERYTKSAKD